MNTIRCAKCGCKISEGDLRHRITVEMVADYGDILSDLQEEVSEYVDRLFYQPGESEELDRSVYEEISFIFCKTCMNLFLRGPLGSKNRFAPLKMGTSHLLH